MSTDKRLHRRSIRLSEYDYTQAGAYYVTICTHARKNIFAEICDDHIILNPIGEIVWHKWMNTLSRVLRWMTNG